jgi:glycosyltransferase involved in cell wall biosynthesis
MRYLQDQGYDVSIICPPGCSPNNTKALAGGIPVKRIPFNPGIGVLDNPVTFPRLVRYFQEVRFDIVHTHTPKAGLVGRLAAKAAGVPIIVHTLHGFDLYDTMPTWRFRLLTTYEKLGAACCHFFLSQNKQDLEIAVREGICPPDRISHLGSGIDLNRIYPGCVPPEKVVALRTNLGLLPHHPVIGFVAPLEREKGIYEFIDAVSILRSRGVRAKYVVVGTPQRDNKISISPERLIQEYGVEEDVMLLRDGDMVPELLSLMNIVVLPSYYEGMPRVLMESAAMGKPAVASKVRGNVEVVEDRRTGLLVPVRDAPALAKGILSLLSDPERVIEMGRQARERALTEFDERRCFWRTDLEYRRLLKARLALDPSPMLKPVPSSKPIPGM